MAEVTRVPLQPIASGSLSRLWIGLAVLAVLAALAAWLTPRPVVVIVDEITAGSGPSPTQEDVAFVTYVGKLDDGTVFDESPEPGWPVPGILPDATPMTLDGVIPGFADALVKMQKGGTYNVRIPAELAYGDNPQPGSKIPPGADLNFEMTLVDFMSREEADTRYTAMLQAMGEMGPPMGAPEVPVP